MSHKQALNVLRSILSECAQLSMIQLDAYNTLTCSEHTQEHAHWVRSDWVYSIRNVALLKYTHYVLMNVLNKHAQKSTSWKICVTHFYVKIVLKSILNECASLRTSRFCTHFMLTRVCSREHIIFQNWACSPTCSISWAYSMFIRVTAYENSQIIPKNT
jgi:hypothetical protein